MHDLIILGQGPSMHNCPFDTETWASLTILGHKEYEDAPISKVFLFDMPENKPDEALGLVVAQRRGIPIVSNKGLPCVTEAYPMKAIVERFRSIFFMNDTSYMIALALYKGYKSLLLWGVDQSDEHMYIIARKYVTYWLGVATGMGVHWEMAPDSLLWRKGV